MKKGIKKLLNTVGVQVSFTKNLKPIKIIDEDLLRRVKIINTFQVDVLLDVGANNGNYATTMRNVGFSKKIISFEPQKKAFDELQKISEGDNLWQVNHFALGNEDGNSVINIAGNSLSSSILEMLPKHSDTAPESIYVEKENITIKKLDTIFNSIVSANDIVMLKIDTQGFEKNVLDGAENALKNISIIQLEMSIVPLYKNEILMLDMIKHLDEIGFQLFSIENGFSDPSTGQLLQADGVFVNKNKVIF